MMCIGGGQNLKKLLLAGARSEVVCAKERAFFITAAANVPYFAK
jgi:hypothetical protein